LATEWSTPNFSTFFGTFRAEAFQVSAFTGAESANPLKRSVVNWAASSLLLLLQKKKKKTKPFPTSFTK
jgi:hypothetical protein